ncbi:MAG TPA: lysylphosphatidylglycerol synthase domain-containing protein [Bacillota bacterium]|nr:lysylphosphatidylglycerol synthase domain-containing protein [Bacillota bacterium]
MSPLKKYSRIALAILIIGATFGSFIYYLVHHPNTATRLRDLPPGTLLLLLVLYGCTFLTLSVISWASLHLYSKPIKLQENVLFNAYSSLINFFGPGQSGPVFRGAYLKKRHNLGIKQYVFATLVYYSFYAVFSACLMFAGAWPWWQTALVMGAAGGVSVLVIRWYKKGAGIDKKTHLQLNAVFWIGLITAVQVVLMTIIYGIELHSVAAHASIGQVMSYTGVANLALFVALTPGAIGIREGFLVFSQQLHHINSGVIVAANVVDRGVYLVLLGILFIVILTLHAKDKLLVNDNTPSA